MTVLLILSHAPYGIERMMKAVLTKGGPAKACGTRGEARGIDKLGLIEGAALSTISRVTQWVLEAGKGLTF